MPTDDDVGSVSLSLTRTPSGDLQSPPLAGNVTFHRRSTIDASWDGLFMKCCFSVDNSGVPMEVYVPITRETFESIRPKPPTR